MKKRKILFFANIAILCLSVFIFVFGIYAANNAHVKSGGTIKFAATNIYAKITRTVSGHDTSKGNVVASESKIIDARTETTDGSTVLSFDDEMYFDKNPTEIVMTFTIENLSSKRNLDFSFTRNNATQTNISDVATVSANMYDTTNKIYNVNPKVDNVNNIETITIKFNVEDWEASGILDYDYTINLSNQATISSNIQSTNLTRAGNTYVATNALAVGNQLSYSVEGTTSYYEYLPVITDENTITSAIHVFGSGLTAITIENGMIDSTKYIIEKTSEGKASIKATSAISGKVTLPTAVNTSSDGLMLICFLPDGAFSSSSNLTSIKLPAGIESIGFGCFNLCKSLVSINWSNNIESIGSNAFAFDSSLVFNKLPQNLKSLKTDAFYGCTSLTNILIFENLNYIEGNPFTDCANIKEIVIDENNIKFSSTETNNMIIDMDTNTLVCGLANVNEIPEFVTKIGSYAFAGTAVKLTSLSDKINFIGEAAFYNCTSIALTSLPNEITTIYDGAFQGCTNLALTSLPKNLTTIGAGAFAYCTSMTLVSDETTDLAEFPKDLITIGSGAFQGCSGLKYIYFYEALTSIGSGAFVECTGLITIVNFPNSVESVGSSAFAGCTSLTTINYLGINAEWNAISGISNAGFQSGVIVWTNDGSVRY